MEARGDMAEAREEAMVKEEAMEVAKGEAMEGVKAEDMEASKDTIITRDPSSLWESQEPADAKLREAPHSLNETGIICPCIHFLLLRYHTHCPCLLLRHGTCSRIYAFPSIWGIALSPNDLRNDTELL